MSEKKKQRIILTVVLSLTAVLLCGGIHIYSKTVNRLLKKDMEQMLLETSGRGSSLIEEKIRANFMLLHSLADVLTQSDSLWSQQNIDLLVRQQENEDVTRFLLADTTGRCKTSDGLEGSMADDEIFHKSMNRDEVISGIVPSAVSPGSDVIVLNVQIRKNGQLLGLLSCVYDIDKYKKVMDSSLFGDNNYSYVVDANGTAIIWPSDGPNPIGLSNQTAFTDPDFMSGQPVMEQLSNAMRHGETGITKFRGSTGGDYYIAYRPIGFNSWYYIDVVPMDAISQKAQIATKIIWFISFITALIILVMVLAFVIIHYKHDKAMEYYALHDRLTGLSNWQNFKETFPSLTSKKFAYVFFYLNDFQYINNVFGFSVGGGILKHIAAEINNFLEKDEHAARLSENYFALFLHYSDEMHFKNRLNNLFTMLEKITVSDDSIVYDYQCTYTGGVCPVGDEEKAEGFERLNGKADIIVEGIPASRKTTWKYFDDTVKKELNLRHNLAGDVYRALAEHQFISYFQPLYDLRTKEICGAETLVRWNHPEKGTLPPKSFLKLLEASGCILELDTIMLEAACRSLQKWLDDGLLPVPLSVNISGLNLYRQDFISSICAITKKYRVPAGMLTLELPESTTFDNDGKALAIAKELKAHGFRLATDNFRTNAAPLNLLASMPLDIIKIKAEFLASSLGEQRSSLVISKIVQLTSQLDVKLVAAGVETLQEEEALRQLGCSYAQGYLYARPMPVDEFEKLLFEEKTS